MKVDLTVLAIPGFMGAMAAEYAWHVRNPDESAQVGGAGSYELADTMASLTMGVGSLIAPFVTPQLLDPISARGSRYAKALMGVSLAAAAVVTAGDVVQRTRTAGLLEAGAVSSSSASPSSTSPQTSVLASVPGLRSGPDTITGSAAVTALASTAVTISALWSAEAAAGKLFRRSPLDLGSGPLAYAVAIVGWDFLYYWNHRLSHESRWLWAVHVVHHSSERYNFATALRQPVAEALTIYIPYGALSLLGVRPGIVQNARSVNLLYQFWVHTESIRSIGALEKLFNSPSHHRVHHGSNRRYLDRNHGGILILWDRLFGTFEPERELATYGLTTNIHTYNPLQIATHEWASIARDVFRAQTWRDRLGFLLRGPGWAGAKRV